jgi:uncharacterized membrane protein HdeD (DUF308 family)
MEAQTGERTLARMAGPWWIFLITGIAWLIVAKIVLDADFGSVAAIATMAGFLFIFAGLNEFVTASVVDMWRWLHAVMGFVFILAGVFSFVRPGTTFLAFASIIGWYLLFKGFLDITVSLSDRTNDLWWFGLVVGIVELLIGFWAAGSPQQSIALLIIWVGAAALARGIMEIFLAFRLRAAQNAP